MIRTRVLTLVALAAAAAVSLGACGTSARSRACRRPLPSRHRPPRPHRPRPSGPALTASPTAALGTVVVDGTGYTLYRFDKDKPKPSKSNCNGSCATQWPPVLVASAAEAKEVKLDGVDAGAVNTVKRADGKLQLTIGGWPVYRYSGDKAAGDTTGQGVGKVWFAVTPAGKKAVATG